MKRNIFLATLCSVALYASATDVIWFKTTGNQTLGLPIADADSIYVQNTYIMVQTKENGLFQLNRDEISEAVPGESDGVVDITYNGSSVAIVNPRYFENVSVATNNAYVTVTSTTDNEVAYRLNGSSTDGNFKIYSDKKIVIELNALSLASTTSAAINIQSEKKASIFGTWGTSSSLSDGSKYSNTPDDESEKGCIYSLGKLVFYGGGSTISVTGNKKNAICTADEIEITEGSLKLTTSVDDSNCLKADKTITVSGGSIDITLTGDQSKGLNCDEGITFNGGSLTCTASGNVVLEDNDPSYCTVIKTDGDLTVNSGSIKITHSGEAGKGISIDGNAYFYAGTIDIVTTGDGDTYTNTDGEDDSYSATCIKADGNIEFIGGTFTLSASGSAGKCISADTDIIIGNASSGPTITATTTGEKFVESVSTYVAGMNDDNVDYANPKIVKADNNLTVNNGYLTLKSTQDGGEGLESKNILTINGGTILIETVDDCINASTEINITGGQIRGISTGNDAMDSNGTLSISGGTIIMGGSSSPETGIDCDNNTFTITGGTIIGLGGGSNSTPSSSSTQKYITFTISMSNGTLMTVTDSSLNHILSLTNPLSLSGSSMGGNMGGGPGGNMGGPNSSSSSSGASYSVLVSTPNLQSSTTYSIYTGGSISGGTVFQDLTTGATYTAGTRSTTATAK